MQTARYAERAGGVAALMHKLSGRPARWWSTIIIIVYAHDVAAPGQYIGSGKIGRNGGKHGHDSEHSAVMSPRKAINHRCYPPTGQRSNNTGDRKSTRLNSSH